MSRQRFILFFLIHFFYLSSTIAATNLGRIWVNDPILGNRVLVYEKVGEYAIIEGDILIGKIKNISAPSASVLSKIAGGLWPHGVIPFELAEDLPVMNKLATLQAITLWEEKTHLKFIELTSKNRELYVDYLSFIPASGTTCASFVGKQKGRQVVNLAQRCHTLNTVHEIGHALGLWHEQSRTDRDNYVRIIWENIAEDHRYNFDQHITDGRDYGEYDYQSIMHYPADAFSKNGLKTIIPLKENAEIGQRQHLTENDIAAINEMYPEE